MGFSYTQVPPDSTGDKLLMKDRVVGADTVAVQGVTLNGAEQFWSATADAVAFATNKHHISLLNASGSGKCVTLHALHYIDLSLTAVTGVGIRFELKKISAASSGTTITAEAWDTNNTALPAGVTVRTNGSITEGNLLYPFAVNNDEIPLTGINHNFPGNNILAGYGDPRVGRLVLREGQGITVKQITSSTVGSFAWLALFGVEDTFTGT